MNHAFGQRGNLHDARALEDKLAMEGSKEQRKKANREFAMNEFRELPPLEQLKLWLKCFEGATTEEEKTRFKEKINEATVTALKHILDWQTSCVNKIENISSICGQLIKVGIEETEFFSTASIAIFSLKKKRSQILKKRRLDTPVSHNGPRKA